ncbi:MAG: fibronectin type III domain-containing protein, partial [Bacteroidales bacterium]|nr:fibronectin type III domain-containing protein [Bacteroidales bacterium]
DDITLDRTSACLTPSNMTFSDITADSCTVFWNERGLAVRYAVEYSAAPIVPGTGAARTLYVNSNICRLGGLLPNTAYYVYVRALCGSSSSFWLQGSFRTMCQPVQLPFSEDFSSWSVGPLYGIDSVSCWRFGTNDDPSNTFRIIDGTDAHSETHNAIFAASNGKYSYMTLPVVGVPVRSLTLSLWLKKYGGTDSLVFVGVMDNPYDIATYTPVDTLTLVEHWQSYSVPFDSYTNQGRCVALMTKSCWVYVDDIFLNYSRGCFVPTDLRVSAVTSNSVTLKWTSCPNRITSLIEYGFAGFTYGTGTVITSTTNTITVTGLLTNTNYDFYLRDVCGLDTSGATLPVSAQPGAWITRLNEIDTVELCGNVLYDDGGPTGNYNHGQNSTVILKPSIPGYKVYIYGTYQCLYSDIMYVYDGIGTGGTLLARFSCPSSSAYNVPAISVGPVRASDSSGALTVLFIGRSMCPGYALNVVCGRPIPHPQCDPPSSLSVLGVTNSSATVSWGDTGFFQVTCKEDWNRYWPEGFYESDTGYTFTGLFTGMPYEWRVRKICEVEGYSDTTDWVYSTFTTSGGDIPCDMPHGIAVREYTATTATVTWVGSGIYDVDYRKTGTSEWSSCTQINANEYTITGLSPATQYQWRVRRVCADDVHSSWTGGTFTTRDTDGITAADLGGVSIAVYPNPAAPGSDVEVSIKGAYGPVTLTLYDAAGRALQSVAQAIPTAPSACFHLQAPSRGTYFLKLRTPTSTTTHKLVIR